MRILALDIARRTGWALGGLNDQPESGSVLIVRPDASMAKLFSDWRLYLHDFISLNPGIDLVVFESPLVPSFRTGNTNINTLRQLIGLAAVTEELLYGRILHVREATVSAVRSHFIGSNRHKRPDAKRLTLAKCSQLGWPAKDDNAADALALWDYQRSLLIKEDLFRRGR